MVGGERRRPSPPRQGSQLRLCAALALPCMALVARAGAGAGETVLSDRGPTRPRAGRPRPTRRDTKNRPAGLTHLNHPESLSTIRVTYGIIITMMLTMNLITSLCSRRGGETTPGGLAPSGPTGQQMFTPLRFKVSGR